MKARNDPVSVTLKAKVIPPRIGANIEPRLMLTGHNWKNIQAVQDVCAHGIPLRYACDWCKAHFRGR